MDMSIRIRSLVVLLSIFAGSFIFISAPVANAGCRDYPESITPGCVAQNLAEEQARQAADSAKRARDLIDAENRAKAQAEADYIANGSRPCSSYPASITLACVAENLADAAKKSAAMDEKTLADQKEAAAKAAAQSEADYIANGSRPCTLYPASITAACAAENLEYETKRQLASLAKSEADLIEAEQKALKQAQDDYIRNGSRPCSVFPASTTAECAQANLKFEEIKKVEIAALTAARKESTKSLITTKDENGSLIVAGNVPKGVDLLNTKIKLLNSKGKVVDTGEIRYEASGKPYFVFDKQVGKGNYKIELTIAKKKPATISVKL